MWDSIIFILILPSILFLLQTRYEMMFFFFAIWYANSLLIEILVSAELVSDKMQTLST